MKEKVARFGVYDEAHQVLLVAIPKVACSVLKATVVMNSPRRAAYLALGKPIHDFVKEDRVASGTPEQAASGEGVFRFTVLREPASRILSAYLNKFIRAGARQSDRIMRDMGHAVRVGQAIAGVADNPARGLTFEEFVHFLAQAKDRELNSHWMPQARFVGRDLGYFDFVGRFERLSETFDMLEQRFGYITEREASIHLAGSKNNTTRYDQHSTLAEPHRRLPAELRALSTGYPPAERFLTPALREMLVERFAEDARLHGSAGGAACAPVRPDPNPPHEGEGAR